MGLFDQPPPPPRTSRPLTVSELTSRIRERLEAEFGRVTVIGEVTNVRRPGSGHIYLTLKDEAAQLSAVIWRGIAAALPFDVTDGMAVVVQGDITVYEPRGSYQIVIRRIEPSGVGRLELAFRRLCEKLRKEGLFAEEHKQPVPRLPRTVGVVTSPTGAAIRDILQVIDRRFAALRVLISPVRVQGEDAAAEIAAAIADQNAYGVADVLIVGRGGGSLEDLWAFNEEAVARAIFASRIPIISAVGHEIDLTVSDLVADARAPTPTAAAEMVTRAWAEVPERIERARNRLVQALLGWVETARQRVVRILRSYAFRRPLEGVRRREQRRDELAQRLFLAEKTILLHAGQRLATQAGRLEALNPLNVLARGYSISLREGDARPLRDAAGLSPGDRVTTRLHRGAFRAIIEDTDHG